MAKLPPAALHRLAQEIRWWHSVPLGEGLSTKGIKPNVSELEQWKFPADLTGKTVLDIGCNDGGFSIAALQRGAREVLSIDALKTPGMAFLLEHEVHPLRFREMDLFSPEFLELPAFDFVIFAGVLYHLHDPMEALKRVKRVTGGMALIETHIDERIPHIPSMCFYENAELNNDPSNWWGPNRLCLEAMMRAVGFKILNLASHYVDQRIKMGRAAYYVTHA